MAMFTQITGLTRLPRTEAERTQVTEGLCWERVPVDMPVFIDVWSDQQFSLDQYTDGIHAEYHEDEDFVIDEELVSEWRDEVSDRC